MYLLHTLKLRERQLRIILTSSQRTITLNAPESRWRVETERHCFPMMTVAASKYEMLKQVDVYPPFVSLQTALYSASSHVFTDLLHKICSFSTFTHNIPRLQSNRSTYQQRSATLITIYCSVALLINGCHVQHSNHCLSALDN